MTAPRLTSAERLGVAVFLAGLAHMVLILGLRFRMPRADAPHALSVTLVATRSAHAPRHARRLAQVAARGGGGIHARTSAHSPFALHPPGGSPHPRPQHKRAPRPGQALRFLGVPVARQTVTLTTPARPLRASLARTLGRTRRLATEEARLRAEIRRDFRALKARGRGRGGVDAQRFAYAQYIARWNHRMEHLGNGALARLRTRLAGKLVLAVRIKTNGRLAGVKILKPAAEARLDAMAVALVKRAAPFAPLPAAVKRPLPILAIIETWRFRAGRITAAHPSVPSPP